MKLIKVEEARPGNRVARDVTDLRGNLLFKSGTELNAEMIDRIRARNVTHLFVEDAPTAGVSNTEAIARKQVEIEAEVDGCFGDVGLHPVMAELREAAKRYLRSKVK